MSLLRIKSRGLLPVLNFKQPMPKSRKIFSKREIITVSHGHARGRQKGLGWLVINALAIMLADDWLAVTHNDGKRRLTLSS